MRVIIAAATWKQAKWGDFLGVPPHLAPVHGEPLLVRTVRQALAHSSDVHVTTPDDERYAAAAKGATCHVRSDEYPSEYESTRELWSNSGRTVLLYGDVYWTDAAMTTVAGYERRQYQCFARRGPSRVTGYWAGEVFGASWWPEQHSRMDEHLADIAGIRARGEITRPTAWMLLRAWQGTPLGRHQVDPAWCTEIDDLTEDFDIPVNWDMHPAGGGQPHRGTARQQRIAARKQRRIGRRR